MSDRADDDEPQPDGPTGDPGGDAGGSHVSFVQRLHARLGRELDPGIHLQDEAEPGGTGRAAAPREDASGSLGSGRRLIDKLVDSVHLSSRYRIADELARGGMGTILRVWDDDLRRNLAMKVMHGVARTGSASRSGGPEEERLVRFLEEAQITGQLDHPGIVPVHDLGIDPKGRCYFTMRLVRGRELKEILQLAREGREGWTLTRALGIVLKVCEAMAFAHSKGVVHRDLKPSNVMVGRFGETYVMDWGLARVLGSAPTREALPRDASSLSIVRTDRRDTELEDPQSPLVTLAGDVVGTPSYMAPEQARGDLESLGPRADVYSLGAILYELLTGRVPYLRPEERVSAHQVLSRVLDGPPEPVGKLAKDQPAELVAICEQAMARDQERRYASMLAVAEDLQAFLEDRVVKAYGGGALVEIQKWIVRNKGAALALGALLAVAAASAIGFNVQKSRQLEALAEKEAETDDARRRAEQAAALATSARVETEEALLRAQESATAAQLSEDRAQRSGYAANLQAAVYSMRLGEVEAALERLAGCEEGMRGWEWSHLSLATDPTLTKGRVLVFPADRVELLGDGERAIVLSRPGVAEVVRLDTLASVVEEPLSTGDMTMTGGLFSPRTFDTRSVLAVRPGTEEVAMFSSGTDVHVVDLAVGSTRRLSLEPWLAGREELGPDFDVPNQRGGDDKRFVRSLAWSPDGRWLVAGTVDGSVLLFDVDVDGDPAPRPLRDSLSDAVLGLAWDARGARLAGVSRDGAFAMWDAQTLRMLRRVEQHEAPATDVVFDPRRRKFLTCGRDGAVLRWGLQGEFEATIARVPQPLQALAVRADTGSIAAVSAPYADGAHGELFLLEPVGGVNRVVELLTAMLAAERVESRSLQGAVGNLQDVFFGPDGATVGAVGDEGTLYVWDLEGPLSRTPLGEGLATDTLRALMQGDTPELAWDGIRDHGATQAAFSPLGDLAATAGAEGDIVLWDLATGLPSARLRGHSGVVSTVAFSPDGSLLASGSYDDTVRLWDPYAVRPVRVLRGHERWVDSLHFSPDGRQLYSAGGDQGVRVWEVETGESSGVLTDEALPRGATTALSPDGRLLACAAREVLVFDVEARRVVTRLPRALGRVRSMCFTSDGRSLWVGYTAGRLLRWSLETSEQEVELQDHQGDVVAVVATRDGSRLLSCARDAAVYVRDPETGDVLLELVTDEPLRALTLGPDDARVLAVYHEGRSELLESVPETRAVIEARRVERARERLLRERVRPRVLALVAEHAYPSEVRAALQRQEGWGEPEVEAALALLDTELDVVGLLGGRARAVLYERTGDADAYARALAQARAATELEPGDLRLELLLGVAELRAGRPAQALEVLTRVRDGALAQPAGERMLDDEGLLFADYHLLLAMAAVGASEQVPAIRAEVEDLLRSSPALRVRASLADLRAEVATAFGG